MLGVTHDPRLLSHADRVIALDNGRIVAADAAPEATNQSAFQALLDPSDHGALVSLTGSKDPTSAWVRADHVLLASIAPAGLSARHIWEVKVAAVDVEASGSVMVQMEGAAGVLRARVTQAAAEELALAPGAEVWAIVKAHAL